MVLLLHEQRYFCLQFAFMPDILFFFDSTFSYFKICFTLILNKLMETPLFAHWGGQQGGVMSQIMYTEDINKG